MKIYPLPVKKNKRGELVASLSVTRQYRQIMEEVMEAHAENVGVFESNEAEELADVITCCITRLAISAYYADYENFNSYVSKLVTRAKPYYTEPKDFYTDLAFTIMQSYGRADGLCNDECKLSNIIVMCVKHLESMGYNEVAREKIYAAVNEKNRRRGYLTE